MAGRGAPAGGSARSAMRSKIETTEEPGAIGVRKKKGDTEMLSKVRLAYFEEGLCVQVMHIGPYATEPATIERMKEFMRENGLQDNVGPNGKHHEIYLGDPRKAKPEKLKTVLRHPLEKV